MLDDAVLKAFYENHLPNHQSQGRRLSAPCPFCSAKKNGEIGRLTVLLNPDSHFYGYFRCSRSCVPAGFHVHFAGLLGLDPARIPGYDPDFEPYVADIRFPVRHMGNELEQFTSLLGQAQQDFFSQYHIPPQILGEMRIGFNGRYLIYPYFQENGYPYSAHCILPGRPEDQFWHGDEAFSAGESAVYNVRDIAHCQGGALFVTDSELSLLILKSLGYPAIAVPSAEYLVNIKPQRLAGIETIFLLVAQTPEAQSAARDLAVGLGFKARLLVWPPSIRRGEHLAELITDRKEDPAKIVSAMVHDSKAFSPFHSPEKERIRLQAFLSQEKGRTLLGLETGFIKLDSHMEGLRGINILGGPPKVGKSCFFMQISTEVARRKVPVIYYDFENGRQKIYLRTLVRLSRIAEKSIRSGNLQPQESERLQRALTELETMLVHFKVVTDRQLTPDSVRRHIDFVKHESRKEELLIVVDSLHKLPFKDLTERRTGIDSWLRWLEAIRDEQQVCFLVISELSRGKGGGYGEKPDLSSFKESGDIEYSADNAMILMPDWDPMDPSAINRRKSLLWVVASRESNPGAVAEYELDYPYWNFIEL